jgi:hypothetical protein
MNALETRAVHAGRRDLAGLGVHVPSIDLSTTNPLTDVESGGEAYEALATGGRPIPGSSLVYSRLWNLHLCLSAVTAADPHEARSTRLKAHGTQPLRLQQAGAGRS